MHGQSGVSAFLPESYVRYPAQRMALYKRIAPIRRREDMEDMADELIDRYGDLPAPADSLLHIAYLRALAVSCGIRNIRQDGNAVFLVPEKLDLDVRTELSSLLSGKLRINMAQDVSVRLQIKPGRMSRRSSSAFRALPGAEREERLISEVAGMPLPFSVPKGACSVGRLLTLPSRYPAGGLAFFAACRPCQSGTRRGLCPASPVFPAIS